MVNISLSYWSILSTRFGALFSAGLFTRILSQIFNADTTVGFLAGHSKNDSVSVPATQSASYQYDIWGQISRWFLLYRFSVREPSRFTRCTCMFHSHIFTTLAYESLGSWYHALVDHASIHRSFSLTTISSSNFVVLADSTTVSLKSSQDSVTYLCSLLYLDMYVFFIL